MLSAAEFARFKLLLDADPELADAALRKVAEWRLPPEPTEKTVLSPEEAFAALIDEEVNEKFANACRADNAVAEAAFIIGRRIIRLPDGRKVRPTPGGYEIIL